MARTWETMDIGGPGRWCGLAVVLPGRGRIVASGARQGDQSGANLSILGAKGACLIGNQPTTGIKFPDAACGIYIHEIYKLKVKSRFARESIQMSSSIGPARVGRPVVGEKKSQAKLLRLDPGEHEAFLAAASHSGLTLSAWMRERLRRAACRELEDANLPIAFFSPKGGG